MHKEKYQSIGNDSEMIQVTELDHTTIKTTMTNILHRLKKVSESTRNVKERHGIY